MIRTYIGTRFDGDVVEREIFVTYKYKVDDTCGNVIHTTRTEFILIYSGSSGTQRVGCQSRIFTNDSLQRSPLDMLEISNQVINEDQKRFGKEEPRLIVGLSKFDEKYKEVRWNDKLHGNMSCVFN
jgi:hypothetical protein